MENRLGFLWALILAAAVVSCPTLAQEASKIPRVGYLSAREAPETRDEAFRQGLRALGYIEGKSIAVEYRYSSGNAERLRVMADELVGLKVDVIVSAGSLATRAARAATTTIPIVMALDPDPVGSGFAASLARPGGNITGLSTLAPEISGKQLELLKQIVPKLTRVAVFGNSRAPGNAQKIQELELAARKLDISLQYLDVLEPKDIEPAVRATVKGRSGAIMILVAGSVLLSHRAEIVELARKNKLPTAFNVREYVEDGGLMSYGVNIPDLFFRAATYMDKILKGAKPANLPIEQPAKFELVINRKTAKALRVSIPQSVLIIADKVID